MTRNNIAVVKRRACRFIGTFWAVFMASGLAVSLGAEPNQTDKIDGFIGTNTPVVSGSSGSVVQTSGEAPVASKSGIELGRARKSNKAQKNELADEFEGIPNLNVRADTDAAADHKPHGAKFLEVMPGETKFSSLSSNPMLKNPVATEKVDGFDVATYQIPALDNTTVQVVAANDIVEAIMINFSEPRSESDAKKAFENELKDVRPIWSPDETGNFREVFPEKGIAFVLEKGEKPGLPSNRVIQVVAETVKCEYFIMRAEQDMLSNLTYARDDAAHALLHDPNAPGADWILAQTHLAVGDFTNARKYVYKAIKLNDSMPQFHLTYIDALIQSGEVESALRYMDAVRDSFAEHPLFAIEAVCLDSVLRREAKSPDYDGAISQGQHALKMLQSLYDAKPQADVYLAAKELELRANLSIAVAVAQKRWNNPADQDKAFEWLEAAEIVAKEIDSTRPKDSQLPTALIDVLESAIKVCLEIPDSDRVDNYVQQMKVSAELYLRKTLDEVSAASVRWRAGHSLMAAARILEARKDLKQAIGIGAKGLEYLQIVTEYRPLIDRVPVVRAQLQLGSLLSKNGDSNKSFELFNKSNDFLEQISNDLKERDSSEVGILLVPVASLYWKGGDRDKAVQVLTLATMLLEKAYKTGYVKDEILYVAYSNLSTMCKGLKKVNEAEKYKKIAEKYSSK